MPTTNPQDIRSSESAKESSEENKKNEFQSDVHQKPTTHVLHTVPPIGGGREESPPASGLSNTPELSGNETAEHDNVRNLHTGGGARGTAAMDPHTRQEVARKGGLAVSRNKQHMAEIGRKGGQSVSKNREHMAKIGRKGGAASRGQRGSGEPQT
jgi:general stress protein YciG